MILRVSKCISETPFAALSIHFTANWLLTMWVPSSGAELDLHPELQLSHIPEKLIIHGGKRIWVLDARLMNFVPGKVANGRHGSIMVTADSLEIDKQ